MTQMRYCIEYINPRFLLLDNGKLNVRHLRVPDEHWAEMAITLILSFGGKIYALYRGNVVDGKLGEWETPTIVDPDDWFSEEWFKALSQPSLPSGLEEAAVQAHIRLQEGEGLSFLNIFQAGAEWQKAKMMKIITKDDNLEEAGTQYVETYFRDIDWTPDVIKSCLQEAFISGGEYVFKQIKYE